MNRRKHWTEQPGPCICGMKPRSYQQEARHRHNFPALCNKDGLRRFYAREERLKAGRKPYHVEYSASHYPL